jgi:NAD-dependent deacetylase
VDTARDLAALLAGAAHAVVLTGAGVSTESGIPDFRGPDGTWRTEDPTVVASMPVFMRDPARFWAFHRPRIDALRGVAPNPAHLAIAELERMGVVRALITQNIDGLHARAGSPAPIQVHGGLDRGTCPRCGREIPIDALTALADAAPDGVPRCEGCGFQMKSGVVLFGEALPPEAVDAAFAAADAADVMLVVGSSLLVAPVSGLPQAVLAHGGRLAILTEGPTPYDEECTVRLHGRAGEVLPEVVALMGAG